MKSRIKNQKLFFRKRNGRGGSKRRRGQAMLLSVIFFLLISLTIILGITVPVVNHIKDITISTNAKQSYILAEALNEDALYRLNHNKSLSNSLSIALNGATAAASVTTSGSNKQIISQGVDNNVDRIISSTFNQGQGVSFNYGVQVGQGGISMSGSAKVVGNVYANGNISNGTITGTAVAADSAALNADQINNSPSTPTYNVAFASSTNYQDFSQSFQVSTSNPINKVQFYIKKVVDSHGNSPSDATVYIVTDNNGSPSSNVLAQGPLPASLVSTNYGWIDVVFTSNPALTPGVTYWLVVDTSSDSSRYYVIGANNGGYSSGVSKLGKYNGTWYADGSLDGYFQFYLGGLTAKINGTNVGSGGVGDAWAHDVEGASVAGHLYCQTGQGNNKACDTSRGDPAPSAFPISDANIQDWKDEASEGTTINGDYSPNSNATIGPAVITGNLNLSGSNTLTLTGTLWVKGNVNLSGSSELNLSSSYGSNSGVLVTDGTVSQSGSAEFNGSGSSGSYVLVLTTSPATNYAMDISGNSGSVVLYASNGTMHLSGSVSTNEATAYQIVMDGSASVTYQSGLANENFTSGPSGAWNIAGWQQTE